MENKTKQNLMSVVDFGLFFKAEKKKDCGEDSGLFSVDADKGRVFLGVFDGCGGSGAQRCSRFDNHTEAYIASRACADAFYDWFRCCDQHAEQVTYLENRTTDYLQHCQQKVGEESFLMGTIKKSFPTTAASAVCSATEQGLTIDLFWAGDSRVYLLNADGLAQLTTDDVDGYDAMEDLRFDGVMTNSINLSRPLSIHSARLKTSLPAIVFAATDGCFGYLSTPMEFEQLILDNLFSVDSAAEWEEQMKKTLHSVAGDDYTLSGFSFGYGSFDALKAALAKRKKEMNELLRDIIHGSEEEKQQLWTRYKPNYYRFVG